MWRSASLASERGLIKFIRAAALRAAIRAASLYGRADVVDLLLAAGADPNHVCAGGQTALMGASMHGHVEAARLLLANGADAESPMDTAEDGTAEAPPRKLAKVEPEPES